MEDSDEIVEAIARRNQEREDEERVVRLHHLRAGRMAQMAIVARRNVNPTRLAELAEMAIGWDYAQKHLAKQQRRRHSRRRRAKMRHRARRGARLDRRFAILHEERIRSDVSFEARLARRRVASFDAWLERAALQNSFLAGLDDVLREEMGRTGPTRDPHVAEHETQFEKSYSWYGWKGKRLRKPR